MLTLVAVILMFVSFVFSLGDMVPAAFRRDSARRFHLSDMLALVFLSAVVFAVVLTYSSEASIGLLLGAMAFVGIAWLIAIYALSSAGVGNSYKRFVFIALLPCSLAVSGMWLVLESSLTTVLAGNEPVPWRTGLGAAILAASVVPIRRINDWVAAVDSHYEVQLPARLLQRD